MKTTVLLVVWLLCKYQLPAQNFSRLITPPPIATEIKEPSKEMEKTSSQNLLAQLSAKATDDPAYYLQKSKTQQLNGLVLITGGSLISFFGTRTALNISNYPLTKNPFPVNGNGGNASLRIALTGLVMMAGSIPYFLYSLKNKKIAGLKLTCQKTSFGTSARACKKVTGLTFAIPIGK